MTADVVLRLRFRVMPQSQGPVGPYPTGVETDAQRDEYDRLRRRVLWKMPSGLYVVGLADG